MAYPKTVREISENEDYSFGLTFPLTYNNQLGGLWRLPTRKELENLVCMSCETAKISKKFFPNTPYEPFWTGEKNNWSKTKGFYWSVNFFTGHTFGRFPGHIPNFVRLVREK